jgi:hypothetical protein
MERIKTDSLNTIDEIYSKINEARTNPLKLANRITLSMSYINKRDNILREPNKPVVKLHEGIKSYEEAITYLKSCPATDEITMDETLSRLVQEYTEEISSKNLNIDSTTLQDDKIKFEERCKKFATYEGIKGIVVLDKEYNFNFNLDVNKFVMNLLICDGDSKRLNRNLILNSEFKHIGIGISNNQNSQNIQNIQNTKYCVIVLCKYWKLRKLDENINQLGKSLINLNTESTVEEIKTPLNFNNQNQSQNNISNKSKLKDFHFGLDVIDKKEKSKNSINYHEFEDDFIDEDLILKYDKELDKEINFEEYLDKREFKQIIREGEKIKLIKKITFTFLDGSVRKIFLSKTWSNPSQVFNVSDKK